MRGQTSNGKGPTIAANSLGSHGFRAILQVPNLGSTLNTGDHTTLRSAWRVAHIRGASRQSAYEAYTRMCKNMSIASAHVLDEHLEC